MSRSQVFSVARAMGNAAWWVFVVAVVLNRGLRSQTWDWDWGWTAYVPLTDAAPGGYADVVLADPTVRPVIVVVWIAFAAVVGSALVEWAILRQWRGAVLAVIPFVSLGLIAYAFGDLDRTMWSPVAVLALVLAAVGIRQVWLWRFAPRMGDRE